MRKALSVAAAVLGTSLAVFPPAPSAQAQKTEGPSPSNAIERDIAARKKAFLSQSDDLGAMGKSLSGPEVNIVLALNEKAGHAVLELDATLWFIGVYDQNAVRPRPRGRSIGPRGGHVPIPSPRG